MLNLVNFFYTMKGQDQFVEEMYHFKGEWGIPSLCGLKIVKKKENAIILVTEFYDTNPGTSITNWNTYLAQEICQKYRIDPNRMIFIERTPKMSSTLSFYQETFDRVTFAWDGESLTDPQWERISIEEVIKLMDE